MIKPEMKTLWTTNYFLSFYIANLYKLYFKTLLKNYFLFLLNTFSPIILIVSTLIKIDSKGPIFFKQQRIGLHARKFNLISLEQ